MRVETKRPRSVTITLLGVILLGTWSAARAAALAKQVGLLMALAMRPDPWLLLSVAVVWALLFWGAAVALFYRHAVTRWLIPVLIILHALYKLSLEGLFETPATPIQSWLLRILLYDGIIIFAIWSLNRREAESYFAGIQPAAQTENKQ